MNKKLILVLVLFVLSFTFVGCNGDTDDKEEPKEKDTNLYTTYTDETVMDFTYEGKNFITDGVGEVTLVSCTDGDTARFSNGSMEFAVRFLGIDTPESTYRIDPWGKGASAYTCDKLTNATTIVLEAEDERTDGNGRYLGWVWYDGRLLNLELVEQAYSNARGTAGTKYEDVIYDAELKTQTTDRRIWGEDDPDFDYSLDGVQITIEELVTNMAEYEGRKVIITGVIAAEIKGHPYIQQNGYGIYLYLGFENSVYIAVGNEVRIEGLTLTYYPDKETGSPQLTGFYKRNVEVISEGNVVTPRVLEVKDLVLTDLGSYATINNLTVTEVYKSPNTGDYTITVEDDLGNNMGLHISKSVEQSEINAMFPIGGVVDVTGPLSRYMGQFQFELATLETVIKK